MKKPAHCSTSIHLHCKNLPLPANKKCELLPHPLQDQAITTMLPTLPNVTHNQSVLDEVMFLLTDWLCRVPMVSVAAGHGLKPGHAVVIVASVEEAVAVVVIL